MVARRMGANGKMTRGVRYNKGIWLADVRRASVAQSSVSGLLMIIFASSRPRFQKLKSLDPVCTMYLFLDSLFCD